MLKEKKKQPTYVAHSLLVIATRDALRAYYGARRFLSLYERSNAADKQELRIRFDVDLFRVIISETAPHVPKMIDYLKRNRAVSFQVLAAVKAGHKTDRTREFIDVIGELD